MTTAGGQVGMGVGWGSRPRPGGPKAKSGPLEDFIQPSRRWWGRPTTTCRGGINAEQPWHLPRFCCKALRSYRHHHLNTLIYYVALVLEGLEMPGQSLLCREAEERCPVNSLENNPSFWISSDGRHAGRRGISISILSPPPTPVSLCACYS